MTNQTANHFRTLHNARLVLPNAWDALSARLVESAGATAIATTSAGVAWSLGCSDGGGLGREAAVSAIREIVASVGIPVTADIEGGYGSTPDDVANTVAAVAEAGAVGINIEDSIGADGSLAGISEQSERIAAALAATGDVFINARTDIYLVQVGDPESRLRATIERATAYVKAGADGVFVPGLTDLTAIRSLADSLNVPLNVMAGPDGPMVDQLVGAGATRISLGPSIALATAAFIRRTASELLSEGSYDSLGDGISYSEAQAFFG